MKARTLNYTPGSNRASSLGAFLRAGTVAALAMVCGASAWAEVPTWRLIDADPPSLPTSPTNSWTIGAWGAGTAVINEAFVWIQDESIKKKLKNDFEVTAEPALKKAVATGQHGILISNRYYYVEVEGSKHYGFEPTYVVGIGPDADAVCFSASCHQTLTGKMPAGAFTPDDGWYTWIEPNASGKGYKAVKKYSWQLQSNAAKKWVDAKYVQVYKRVIYQQALADYAVALAKNLPDKTDRSAVAGLIVSRNKAIERRAAVESRLQEELRRAAKAAKANALLSMAGQALQFAQLATMASGMMGGEGIPQSTTGPLNTPADISKVLQNIEAGAAANAAALAIERDKLIDSLKAIDNGITEIGSKGGGNSGFFNPGLY